MEQTEGSNIEVLRSVCIASERGGRVVWVGGKVATIAKPKKLQKRNRRKNEGKSTSTLPPLPSTSPPRVLLLVERVQHRRPDDERCAEDEQVPGEGAEEEGGGEG